MTIISFKATEEMAKYLETKPNKSEYIRQLIKADMEKTTLTEERIRQILLEVLSERRGEFKKADDDLTSSIDSILNL